MKEQFTAETEFILDGDGQNYIIKKYIGNRKVVSIPPIIRGRKVVGIRENAFVEERQNGLFKMEYHSTVEQVTIPVTINVIGASAFSRCKTLQIVKAHHGITEIGTNAFWGCDHLEVIDFGLDDPVPGILKLPKNLKRLDDNSVNKTDGTCIFKEILISRKTKWKRYALNTKSCAVFYYEDTIADLNIESMLPNSSRQYTPEQEFELSSDGVNYQITKYTGSRRVVTIPPVIRGRKVTSVGPQAFCKEEKINFWKTEYVSTVEKVIIPVTITKIDGSFRNCDKLHTVIAHPHIEFLGDFSFFGCNNLNLIDFGVGSTEKGVVKLPPKLKRLGSRALAKTNGSISDECIFREVQLSKKTKWKASIAGNDTDAFSQKSCAVFYYEKGNPEVDPLAYTSEQFQQYTPESDFVLVNDGADYVIRQYTGSCGVVSIPPVIRGRKITKIEQGAFSRREKAGFLNTQDASTVETVIIPQTVRIIGKRAFFGCEKLKNVIAHPGIEVIEDQAFAYCKNLKTLDFDTGERYPGVLHLPKDLKKLGVQSLVADSVQNKCLFEEVVVRRGLKMKNAFDLESCRVFYYDE